MFGCEEEDGVLEVSEFKKASIWTDEAKVYMGWQIAGGPRNSRHTGRRIGLGAGARCTVTPRRTGSKRVPNSCRVICLGRQGLSRQKPSLPPYNVID